MESVLIRMACDADLCATHKSMQLIRENLSLEKAEMLYEMYKASHE